MTTPPAITLDEIRARAAQHDLELSRYELLTVKDLCQRWRLSGTSVRAIPIDELPFLDLGKGLVKAVRRYRLDDVEAYEARRFKKAS